MGGVVIHTTLPSYPQGADPQDPDLVTTALKKLPNFSQINVVGQMYNNLRKKGNPMSSPITCEICHHFIATEAALFASGDLMALCDKCISEAEQFIVNTGCLAD